MNSWRTERNEMNKNGRTGNIYPNIPDMYSRYMKIHVDTLDTPQVKRACSRFCVSSHREFSSGALETERSKYVCRGMKKR